MTKRRSKRAFSLKDLLLSLLLLIVLWAAGSFLDIDLLSRSRVVQHEPTGTLQVTFTAPQFPEDGTARFGGLDERLAKAIDGAERSVDVAAFVLDLTRVTDAMIRAHQRGLRVRLVTDSDYADEYGPTTLNAAGVPVVTDERSAFMHNKFVVIDEQEVWTGSWNLTYNCTYRNNNNVVIVQSTRLADNYTVEFEQMFVDRQFGPTAPNLTPHPLIDLDGVLIETHFESQGDVRERIIDLIEEASTSVHVMAFVFTDDAIAEAIIARHAAGLEVSGVVEARNAGGLGTSYPLFERARVDILLDGNPYNLHHKVIIVDGTIVITGSYNFSASAAERNDENVLIIHSPAVGARYLEEFRRTYREAETALESSFAPLTPGAGDESWASQLVISIKEVEL